MHAGKRALRWLRSLGKPREYGYVLMVHGTGVLVPDEITGEFRERGLWAKRIIRGGSELEAREAAITLVTDELRRTGCRFDDSRSSFSVSSVERGLLRRTTPQQIYGFTFYGTFDGARITE